MVSVLITGAGGYLGSQLSEFLTARNCKVTKIMGTKDCSNLKLGNKQFDVIIHAGFSVDFSPCLDPDAVSLNVENTRKVVDYFCESNSNFLIFLSAAGTLGVSNSHAEEREEHNLATSSPEYMSFIETKYIKDKVRCEDLFKKIKDKTAIVYLTTVYGRNMGPLTAQFFNKIKHAKWPVFMCPPGGTSILDSDDFLESILCLIEKRTPGKWCVSSYNTTYHNLIYSYAKKFHKNPIIVTIPRLFLFLFSSLFKLGLKKIFPTYPVLLSSFGFKYYSTKKIKRDLNWAPKSTLQQTLEKIR